MRVSVLALLLVAVCYGDIMGALFQTLEQIKSQADLIPSKTRKQLLVFNLDGEMDARVQSNASLELSQWTRMGLTLLTSRPDTKVTLVSQKSQEEMETMLSSLPGIRALAGQTNTTQVLGGLLERDDYGLVLLASSVEADAGVFRALKDPGFYNGTAVTYWVGKPGMTDADRTVGSFGGLASEILRLGASGCECIWPLAPESIWKDDTLSASPGISWYLAEAMWFRDTKAAITIRARFMDGQPIAWAIETREAGNTASSCFGDQSLLEPSASRSLARKQLPARTTLVSSTCDKKSSH